MAKLGSQPKKARLKRTMLNVGLFREILKTEKPLHLLCTWSQLGCTNGGLCQGQV